MDFNLDQFVFLVYFLLFVGYYFRKKIDSFIIQRNWHFLKSKPALYLVLGIIVLTFVYNLNNYSLYNYLYIMGLIISTTYLSRKKIDNYIVKKEWFFLKSKPAKYLLSISLICTVLFYIYIFSYHVPYLGDIIYGPKDVRIGNQVWMDKNLDVSTFSNGEPIYEAKNKEDWLKACYNNQPAWCYYDFKSENGRVYGKLYNNAAVRDSRLVPIGYRIPYKEDIEQLIDFLGGYNSADRALKNEEDWVFFSYRGDNSSKFNAVPSGANWGNNFGSKSEAGIWWIYSLYCFRLSLEEDYVSIFDDISNSSIVGFSVRCIKINS